MITCKQASQLMSQSSDCPLSWTQRLQLKLHLAVCDACKHFMQQLNLLRAALHRMRDHVENDNAIKLPPAAKARIVSNMESSQQ